MNPERQDAVGVIEPDNPATSGDGWPARKRTSRLSAMTGPAKADGLATVLLAGLVGAFAFFASRQLATIPAPLGDEPWLMQTAFELITKGTLGLPMFRLLGGNIDQVWMTMPGLFLTLAAFFKAFGFGLLQARAFNVTAACLAVAFVFLIGRKLHSRAAGLIAAFVLAFDANFFNTARIFRNDIPTLACALMAFYFFMRSLAGANHRREWGWGLLGGFLAMFGVLVHPNGVYVFGLVFLWALVDRGLGMFRSRPWWAFVVGALILAIPCGVYVATHYADFMTQWRPDSVRYRGITSIGFFKNIGTEFERYALWRSTILGIVTPDSRAVSIFQYTLLLSLGYLAVRTLWKAHLAIRERGVFDTVREWIAGERADDPDRSLFFDTIVPERSNTGSLQEWMLEQGGWRRRLTVTLNEIERETQPVMTWIQALGSPSHPAWRDARTGLMVVALAAVAFFAAVDTQKSPAYLPYATAWYALCVGVTIVDAMRWGVAQRKRSARRVLYGMLALFLALIPTLLYMGSASRAVWRYYRWSRTFEPAPYAELATVLRRVIPPGLIPVGRPVHWLAFTDNPDYLSANKRIWRDTEITTKPYALIVDERGLSEKDNFAKPFSKLSEQFTLLAELSNTMYGDIKVYYTGSDGKFRDRPVERYYFLGERKGYYSEEQRQAATVVWLAGPAELEKLAQADSTGRPPQAQRDYDRTALRIVTDVSSYTTRLRLPLPPLKPNTLYRFQTAVRVAEGGCLLGVRDRTGLWLSDPLGFDPGKQYVPIDLTFCTNSRGDGEVAVGNRRNRPGASLIYLSQIELREIPREVKN